MDTNNRTEFTYTLPECESSLYLQGLIALKKEHFTGFFPEIIQVGWRKIFGKLVPWMKLRKRIVYRKIVYTDLEYLEFVKGADGLVTVTARGVPHDYGLVEEIPASEEKAAA